MIISGRCNIGLSLCVCVCAFLCDISSVYQCKKRENAHACVCVCVCGCVGGWYLQLISMQEKGNVCLMCVCLCVCVLRAPYINALEGNVYVLDIGTLYPYKRSMTENSFLLGVLIFIRSRTRNHWNYQLNISYLCKTPS